MRGNVKVLAVDDDGMLLDMISKMLGESYTVLTANSASSAAKLIHETTLDIILLDIEMPNISGFEFLTDIRKLPSYHFTPVIVVSSHTGQDFYDEAIKNGANDVLHKPVKKETLVEAIEKALASNG
jgi:PleD family two-component response regulator